MRISGSHAVEGKSMPKMQFTIGKKTVETLTQGLITDNGIGRSKPCHIERLAGRHQRDTTLSSHFRHFSEGHMTKWRQGKISMYLIRYDNHSLAMTNLSHTPKFV